MKTVLFLIPTLMGGGAERVLVNLVNNMDLSKYEIYLQTLFDVGINQHFLNNKIKYIPGFPFLFRGNVTLMKLFSPSLLYKMIVHKRYDFVISFMEGPTARILSGCPYPETRKISWIHTDHKELGDAIGAFRSFKEARNCYGMYDVIVCVAESAKIDFEKLFGIKCVVKYNVNEDSIIKQKALDPVTDISFSNKINIISAGKLHPVKGFDRLLNVHLRLLNEGYDHSIYIIGDGSEKLKISKQITSLGVENSFHLLGFKQNPYKYINKADLYVCSSYREGFSTAVTEALILGKPVVSTCVSGSKELLGNNNEYGIVVDNSENGIYCGIKCLLEDNKRLSYYKHKAEERGNFFSKTKCVNEVESLLDNF